nr:immunoglobulin heavy chain junction region [Homo sapiens]MBN4396559.1 immunoglobulin heavy chain junction region [Homo sapiens]MBN4440370.1 immunoglobulin heavy chain junction region [Homo sapiens]
CASRTLPGG